MIKVDSAGEDKEFINKQGKSVKALTGFSAAAEAAAAVAEACSSFDGTQPKLVLFYADRARFYELAKLMAARFPAAVTAGCTTYASLSAAGAVKGGLLAVAFIDGVSCRAGVIKQITHNPIKHTEQLSESVEALGSLANTICLLYTPGRRRCEELVLDAIAEKLRERRVSVFGGSASMSDGENKTFVALNGSVFEDSSVFVLLRNDCGRIRLYRENIFKPTRHIFTVTDADVPSRIIYSLDNKPIADVLAKALGVDKKDLPQTLPDHPLGRIVGDNIYITEHLGMTADGGISFYARAYNQTRIALLEPDDYRRVLKETIEKARADIPAPAFTLIVNCVSRGKLYERVGFISEFADSLAKGFGPFAGFSALGEQLGYAHFNQTMLAAVFE